MSKQSRLNKEKAARAKANQDRQSNPTQPQQQELWRDRQDEREKDASRKDDRNG